MYYTFYSFEITNLRELLSYECPMSRSMKSSTRFSSGFRLSPPD